MFVYLRRIRSAPYSKQIKIMYRAWYDRTLDRRIKSPGSINAQLTHRRDVRVRVTHKFLESGPAQQRTLSPYVSTPSHCQLHRCCLHSAIVRHHTQTYHDPNPTLHTLRHHEVQLQWSLIGSSQVVHCLARVTLKGHRSVGSQRGLRSWWKKTQPSVLLLPPLGLGQGWMRHRHTWIA